MPDGNFCLLPQGIQNLEAFRLGYIFQVNAAKARLQGQDWLQLALMW
jgi:hypothetical protein